MEFQEFIGANVDAAIAEACGKLLVPSDRLEIDVIAKESSGFFGFGKKPARIRVRIKEETEETVVPAKEEKKPAPKKQERKPEVKSQPKETAKQEPKAEKEVEKEDKKPEIRKENKNKNRRNKKNNDRAPKKEAAPVAEKEPVEEAKPARKSEPVHVDRSEEDIEKIKATADEFLKKVFKAMEVPVEMVINYDNDNDTLEVDFEGEDMGPLIGKRGQTLDSLQYLTSLVINKGESGYIRVKLDTENYRSRRKDTLENLAKNIAFKVRKTRKSVALEAMNPYERRIIHSALQGNKFVETFSEGNEPYRHVVIAMKKGVREFSRDGYRKGGRRDYRRKSSNRDNNAAPAAEKTEE